MKTIAAGNTVFTNVALTDDGGVWWEGLEGDPQHLIDWKGEVGSLDAALLLRIRTRGTARRCRNAPPWLRSGTTRRGCRSRRSCSAAAADHGPAGTQARDWQHGVFIGATLGSEKTAAAEGKVGIIRRDPMAMLPFMGYNAGDYCQHWLDLGKNADESVAEDLLRQLVLAAGTTAGSCGLDSVRTAVF